MEIKADRISAYDVAPGAMDVMYDVEKYIKGCGLEASLIELVKLRASQINGCTFCLDLHSKDARKQGESEQRLICCPAGGSRHSTPRGNGLLWPGRKH